MERTVNQILADPETPQWIKDGVARLWRDNPGYAAFLTAMRNIKVEKGANMSDETGPYGIWCVGLTR